MGVCVGVWFGAAVSVGVDSAAAMFASVGGEAAGETVVGVGSEVKTPQAMATCTAKASMADLKRGADVL